jgi:hypothetical protein
LCCYFPSPTLYFLLLLLLLLLLSVSTVLLSTLCIRAEVVPNILSKFDAKCKYFVNNLMEVYPYNFSTKPEGPSLNGTPSFFYALSQKGIPSMMCPATSWLLSSQVCLQEISSLQTCKMSSRVYFYHLPIQVISMLRSLSQWNVVSFSCGWTGWPPNK